MQCWASLALLYPVQLVITPPTKIIITLYTMPPSSVARKGNQFDMIVSALVNTC